jgi:hypothetical protein
MEELETGEGEEEERREGGKKVTKKDRSKQL